MSVTTYHGDCREIIATLPDCSVDSIVTDPPYELGFMGKTWDASGIAYDVTLWTECLRVLKPGGHLLAFGGTRTYHRMAAAIEDAGFEIRDSIHWIYGSGFPKSLDVSKAIDKAAGAEREVVGKSDNGIAGGTGKHAGQDDAYGFGAEFDITAPATDAARQWEGWGTALKPAHEPIVVARKPLVGTVAANVTEYGTGALNIDGCRAGERWPANIVIDDVIAGLHPEWGHYFYTAKPSRRERDAGLDGLPRRSAGVGDERPSGSSRERRGGAATLPRSNHHPTVKPLALMRHLVRLVTPPGGTVLEPFAGSGTTLAACVLEGFDVIGCELTADYLPIIEGRVAWAQSEREKMNLNLFGDAA